MTVYEGSDDFGFQDTFASSWYGSACKEVACCTIRPYWIDWYSATERTFTKESTAEEPTGRGLVADELGEDMDVFTPEEFRVLFGYEPERFANEMNFDQN